MPRVLTALATSVDGFIAGRNDSAAQPLGEGGSRLFDWYFDGGTRSRFYDNFSMSAPSARFFDEYATRIGAVITGRRTYDIVDGWGGRVPCRACHSSSSPTANPVVHLRHRRHRECGREGQGRSR